MKVLVAPDKFKGTLGALTAAQAIARGWKEMRPGDELHLLPISDGGDGFGELLCGCLNAHKQTTNTLDAAHRACASEWSWEPGTKTAIIEAARTNGLAQLPRGKYHPFELDTTGLARVFQDASLKGARRCLVGIGGSATNDGGFGMARALGWNFINEHGQIIERWTELHGLSVITPPADKLNFEEILVAVDVQNPLLGPQGCTRIYGPQKGLKDLDFEFAERCLGRLSEVVHREFNVDIASEPGTGAAGGLGFGLRTFLNARLERGFALYARYSNLQQHLDQCDIVISGEGAIDASTMMGKGVGELALLCRLHSKPCIGLAGWIPEDMETRALFDLARAVVPSVASQEESFANPAACLERLASQAAAQWQSARR